MILKRKSRYVLVESSRDVDVRDQRTWGDIRAEALRFLGEEGYVAANPFMMDQSDPRHFIIRVSRGAERSLILSLAFIKGAGGKEVGFYTLRTSGTIKALKTKGGIRYKKPKRNA